jgi:hypothetical protein
MLAIGDDDRLAVLAEEDFHRVVRITYGTVIEASNNPFIRRELAGDEGRSKIFMGEFPTIDRFLRNVKQLSKFFVDVAGPTSQGSKSCVIGLVFCGSATAWISSSEFIALGSSHALNLSL